MSLAIKFEGLRPVLEFLRFLAQQQVGYQLADEDRFYVESEHGLPRTGQLKAEPKYTVYVWLPSAAGDHDGLRKVCDLLDGEIVAAVPAASAKRQEHAPEAFLETWGLRKVVPSQSVRLDLLVALYDVERDQLAEAYARLPKGPHHRSTIVFLGPSEAPEGDPPRYLILLPHADPTFQWSMWLEAENRRLHGGANGRRKVKLFYQLSGGEEGDYYVEHGWAHPLAEVGKLCPNAKRARYILIAGADRDGKRRTCWTRILSRNDFSLEVAPISEDLFDLRLEGDVQRSVARAEEPTGKLRLTPTLVEVTAERRAELERLEKRIQTARIGLAQLEQQRAALLERQRGRFYLLLRFRQPPTPAGEVPQLAPDFQRFLLLSRRQLDRLNYLFVDQGAEGGQHVVLTREAVYHQDFALGLASEVFYQPASWKEWEFDVFVRDDCELVPRVDNPELARPLYEALRAGVPEADAAVGGWVLLLLPGQSEAQSMQITALLVPHDAELRQQLRFLNQAHPIGEVMSRNEAREELKKGLVDAAFDLEKEINEIECQLAREATTRLEHARLLWNELAPELERAVLAVSSCRDSSSNFAELLTEFDVGWETFLERVLSLSRDLRASKLQALARLEQAASSWPKELEEVKLGRTDVEQKIAPLRSIMEDRLKEAAVTVEAAREAFEGARQQVASTHRKLADAEGLCSGWFREVTEARNSLDARNRDLVERQDRGQALLTAVREAVARLDEHVRGLNQLITEIEAGERQGEALTEGLGKSAKELGERLVQWEAEKSDVEKKSQETQAAYAQTAQEIARLQEATRRQLEESGKLMQALEASAARLQADVEQEARERDEIRKLIEQVKKDKLLLAATTEEVRRLQPHLQREVAERAPLARELERVSQQLSAALAKLSEDCVSGLASLVLQLDQTALTLSELAKLEEALAAGQSFRRSAEVRAHVHRQLTGAEHKSIWGGSNGVKR